MTEAEKDEMLRLVDRLIREWVNNDIHAENAMFRLRDEMAKHGFAKTFAPTRKSA